MSTDLPGSEGRIRRLRRDEYDHLIETGAFDQDKLELIRGVLVRMTPQGAPHAGVIQRLTSVLVRGVGERAAVRVQLPLWAPDESEPEPDFAVVPPGEYDDSHPTSALLIIEVAHSSLRFDRATKGPLYAEMGVPEYWIVDLAAKAIEVHREPKNGRFERSFVAKPGESIALVAFADVTLAVSAILR